MDTFNDNPKRVGQPRDQNPQDESRYDPIRQVIRTFRLLMEGKGRREIRIMDSGPATAVGAVACFINALAFSFLEIISGPCLEGNLCYMGLVPPLLRKKC